MRRILVLPFVLSAVCAGCDASPSPKDEPAKSESAKDESTKDESGEAADEPAIAKTTANTPPPDEPTPDEVDTGGAPKPESPTEAAPTDAAPKSDDIRDASHVPAGTPPAHASAFQALPVKKGDGAPIGGIGPGGLHLDDLVVGKGWEDSRCTEPSKTFTVDTDDKVSLCLRIVHAPVDENLTISWEREGAKGPKPANLTVKPIHAYRTRAWLPVKSYYVGKWKVRVLAPDDTLLGEATFEITG